MLVSNDFNKLTRPPLGRVPEFDIEEKARSHQAASILYTTPEADVRLAPPFIDLVNFADKFQTELGVEPIEIVASSVHILSTQNMNQAITLLELEEESGGVYDPWTDVIYVREPERADGIADIIRLFYTVSHELGHKLTPGLNGFYDPADDSFIIREGIADIFAREFMHGVFIPKHAPDVATRITGQFKDGRSPYSSDGLSLKPEEVMFVDPETHYAMGFSRIVEARIVEELKTLMGQEAFIDLMRQASSSDILAARQVIVGQLGIEKWHLLTTGLTQKHSIGVLRELKKIISTSSIITRQKIYFDRGEL